MSLSLWSRSPCVWPWGSPVSLQTRIVLSADPLAKVLSESFTSWKTLSWWTLHQHWPVAKLHIFDLLSSKSHHRPSLFNSSVCSSLPRRIWLEFHLMFQQRRRRLPTRKHTPLWSGVQGMKAVSCSRVAISESNHTSHTRISLVFRSQ